MFILHRLLGVVRGMSPLDGVYPSDLGSIVLLGRPFSNVTHHDKS